jgi:hypothetical protein
MVRASRQLITAFGRLGLAGPTAAEGGQDWTVPAVIEALDRGQLLREPQTSEVT